MTHDIPIDELRRMRENGMTARQCADHYGCSVSTINRKMNPKLVLLNRACNKRWHQIGPLESTAREKRCKWCGTDFTGGRTAMFCSTACKRQSRYYRNLIVELSPQQLADHCKMYGLNADAAARLNMTLEELTEALKHARDC